MCFKPYYYQILFNKELSLFYLGVCVRGVGPTSRMKRFHDNRQSLRRVAVEIVDG